MKIVETLINYTEEEKEQFLQKYSGDYHVRKFDNELQAWGYDEFDLAEVLIPKQPELTPEEKLENAKESKIQENDFIRDNTLISGVTYNNILFDSDTDQKANILGAVLQMSDTDTIEWFGMNNDSLVCTKQDLLNIGGLITQLHSFVWNKNAEIKTAINEASTIQEVEAININYKEE